MSKRKTWNELTPVTRQNRLTNMLANHAPKDKHVTPQMNRHSRCAQGAACVGPGCRVRRGSQY